jgi:cytochrome b involved in lipid metabolism
MPVFSPKMGASTRHPSNTSTLVGQYVTIKNPKVANMGHIDGAEVAKHDNKKSCWIVLDSNVYDVTNFMSEHPGGAPIILRNAGTVSIALLALVHVLSCG